MCKHILINEFNVDDLGIVQDFANRSHENDGYGAIIRTKDDRLFTFKSLNQGEFYIGLTEFCYTNQVKTLVVHHRTSTNHPGLDYAHPFEFQGNYMTHNGVVSVPGNHETKTQNDSEQLLHHLIKSDFDTKSVSGYFSCFILSDNQTIVLVDDTAPLFTDGRIYSSHNHNGMTKISLSKITIDLSGEVIDRIPIEVTKSSYGLDYYDKSIGYYNDYDVVNDFLDYMPIEYLESLTNSRNRHEAVQIIDEIAYILQIELTAGDKVDILEELGLVS